ncbi:MAG: 50S ribosomal protein L22 [Thermoplasmata archaeon]|nr:50S ribosomal protein L22 [Thermoplasmata archaeon]
MGYSQDVDEETTAKAYGRELPISPKKAREVCRALRKQPLDQAKALLEDVVAKRRAIPYGRYNKEVAHRPGVGPGGYPVKVAQHLLRLLESAEENAEYKGLDAENMIVHHISAYRGRPVKSYRPRAYGRSSPWLKEMTNVEIILMEVE